MTDLQLRSLARYRRALIGISERVKSMDATAKETGLDPDPWQLIDEIRGELAKALKHQPCGCDVPCVGGDEVRS